MEGSEELDRPFGEAESDKKIVAEDAKVEPQREESKEIVKPPRKNKKCFDKVSVSPNTRDSDGKLLNITQ